ncbi:MAG: tRNA uridine-5-carboxymethylaminomethyl(34) synthesis GTPase MnmE [Saprospiraceae bacterium]|nr:tRNA uridine-5-carboxymethylaminomethyl(34) synthesis GTPase MnmE [Saprospiraceae bacterium]
MSKAYLCGMNHLQNDIIIALATPPGVGAIGVIRLSGKGCIGLVNRFFKGKDLEQCESHTIHLGKIVDEKGGVLDEVLASIFISPKSYTKEDVVELSCHGSSYILGQVMQLFLRHGARTATRGEFTLRAFLNGQLDLSQAEAVADLIASDSAASHELAMKQMKGGFSHTIATLRQELIDFAALIELELDFGEEDVEFADRGKLRALVIDIQKVIADLIQSFYLGNVMKNGVATAIVGRPNAGKSTLLNALLNEERAIVSAIPGTTRDTIEETMNINGLVFRFIDTAGIRHAQDEIEKIGIERSMEKISRADLVLFVVDVTTSSPADLAEDLKKYLSGTEQFFILLNKMDLSPYVDASQYHVDGVNDSHIITTSALHKMNIDYLKTRLYEAVVSDATIQDRTLVTNARHYDALHKSHESLQRVLLGLDTRVTGDFIAMDIRQALHHLGEITGSISSEDLLDSIFSRFCIGK